MTGASILHARGCWAKYEANLLRAGSYTSPAETPSHPCQCWDLWEMSAVSTQTLVFPSTAVWRYPLSYNATFYCSSATALIHLSLNLHLRLIHFCCMSSDLLCPVLFWSYIFREISHPGGNICWWWVQFHGEWFLATNLTGSALQAWLNSEKGDFWVYSEMHRLSLSERHDEWEITYLHKNSGYSLSTLFSKTQGKVHAISSNQSVPMVRRSWQWIPAQHQKQREWGKLISGNYELYLWYCHFSVSPFAPTEVAWKDTQCRAIPELPEYWEKRVGVNKWEERRDS